MVYCVLLLSVISTLTTTSFSLSCVQCQDATDVPCTGKTAPCPSSADICVSKYTETFIAGLLFSKLYMRNCGDRATCSVSSSMTTSHGRVITSSTCCYTEGCSPPRPVLPPVNFKKNGVVCKTCHAMQSQPCDSDTYTDCLGNETKCLSQVSTVAGLTSTAMRGCATPSLCAIPHEEGSLEHLRFISDTTCTDGGAGLHYCLYLLGVTFIGLFKVMY